VLTFVHGTPRNPLNEYLFPEDIYNQRKMHRIWDLFDNQYFNGHTHVPGIFWKAGEEIWEFIAPSECERGFRIRGMKALCNVGSVGQPRDGDPRACYVLLEDDVIRFRRVPYDVDTTVSKIHAIAELENLLGDHLREGR
jgi:diadenosine tetraphosphatase ApaH/serine/threonine PP2A family protein phosphatase